MFQVVFFPDNAEIVRHVSLRLLLLRTVKLGRLKLMDPFDELWFKLKATKLTGNQNRCAPVVDPGSCPKGINDHTHTRACLVVVQGKS